MIKSHRPKHQLPIEMVGNEGRSLTPPYTPKWYGQRDPIVRPESRDPDYLAEARLDAIPAWDPPDMQLADYECKHGRMPTDNIIRCDCWGKPLNQLVVDLRDRLRGLTREEAVVALLAV